MSLPKYIKQIAENTVQEEAPRFIDTQNVRAQRRNSPLGVVQSVDGASAKVLLATGETVNVMLSGRWVSPGDAVTIMGGKVF